MRQPYASLIAVGFKRWEFRSYETKKAGEIGIAASNAEPLLTKNDELNRIRYLLPSGVVLATAKLVTSFYLTADDLKQYLGEPVEVNLHGQVAKTLGEPIGEPIEDVKYASDNSKWNSFAWMLEDVKPLEKPVPFARDSQSTWISVEVP